MSHWYFWSTGAWFVRLFVILTVFRFRVRLNSRFKYMSTYRCLYTSIFVLSTKWYKNRDRFFFVFLPNSSIPFTFNYCSRSIMINSECNPMRSEFWLKSYLRWSLSLAWWNYWCDLVFEDCRCPEWAYYSLDCHPWNG